MGNLWQEHRFQTSDVPGGLGIAQWMGARRTSLMERGNYTDITVQLQYLFDELRGTEKMAGNTLFNSRSLEDAVIAFQNKFERCNPTYCMQDQRIAYARQFLINHTQ